jgi:hypothetical protein
MKWVWIAAGALAFIAGAMALIGALLPKGHHATRRARLRQRPEAIYAVLAGPPDWRSDIKTHGSLPDGKWWEQDGHGRKITYELVEDRAPTRRVIRIADPSLPFGGTWTLGIAADADGHASTVSVTEDGEIYNVIFRFMARFVFGYTSTIEAYLRDLGRKFGETVEIGA